MRTHRYYYKLLSNYLGFLFVAAVILAHTVHKVRAVAFSAGGASSESTNKAGDGIIIHRLPATPGALIADACSRVTLDLTPAESKE